MACCWAETLALVEEYYALSQTDYAKDNDRLSRIQTADIEDLNFDPELVDAFIATVNDYQQIDAVSNDMFGDTTHLNRYQGAVEFTRHLAEEYAELLR